MKRTLLLSLLLTSCATLPAPRVNLPTPQAPRNLIQIDFNGVDSNTPTSQVLQVDATKGFSKQGLIEVSGLTFKNLKTETITTGGGRYLQATFEITNTTGGTLSDLSFVPVVIEDTDGDSSNNSTTVTVGGTEFKNIKLFDGTDASGWATSLIPTYAMVPNSTFTGFTRSTSPSTFKDFIYVDEYDITDPSGLEITETKPYGWKVQSPIANGTTGMVTFSVFFPTTSPNKQNPYSFSVMAAYTEGVPDSNFDTTMSLNVNPATAANDQSRSAVGSTGTPFMAWVEDTKVYVKQWNGTSWSLLGSPAVILSDSHANSSVNIQVGSDNRPVILVSDNAASTLQVLKWNGTGWASYGDALQVSARSITLPLILNSSGNPVIINPTMTSSTVQQWNGTAWEQLGTQVDDDPANFDRSLALGVGTDGLPVVALSEDSNSGAEQLRVKKWNGSSWTTLSSALNVSGSTSAQRPDVVVSGTDVYVSWQEGNRVYASKWNGTSWTLLGGSYLSDSGKSAFYASIDMSPSGMLHVTYRQTDGIKLKAFDNTTSTWSALPYTYRVNTLGTLPQLQFSGDLPVVSWAENGDLYVKQ